MSNEAARIRAVIENGQAAIGIEFGSTRIKTVLIDDLNQPIATGNHDWENDNVDKIWTYSLAGVRLGLQSSYRAMAEAVRREYGVPLRTVKAVGISAMMHGYLVFDQNDRQLVPFRTWRNNITAKASEDLTALFNYPIPQRWSIAHLFHAIRNREAHVPDIAFMTTLAGYVHWQLTGRKVLGIGDASGMFPIELQTGRFNQALIDRFHQETRPYELPWELNEILPGVLTAGQEAGRLTADGARLLDPDGTLLAGVPLCPPEGDAGTGMVATDSVSVRTGNVSAGTSVFAMIVLENELARAYGEIDLVATPHGKLVAMVHSNNCTSDYDAWIRLFGAAASALGVEVPKAKLYDTLLAQALEGDPDCGGLLAYGYISGEHMTHFEEGRPLFVRAAGSRFSLANFMRANLYSSLCALKIGLDILYEHEAVRLDELRGHGGFFKNRGVGQKMMAAAANVPVSVLETAGEGGAWGIAVLAAYMAGPAADQSLDDFLSREVFLAQKKTTVLPDPDDVAGFEAYMKRYLQGLPIEKAAVDNLR